MKEQRLMRENVYKVKAVNPASGQLEEAVIEEDWFGPMKDAIRFSGFNTPHHPADNITWEFA